MILIVSTFAQNGQCNIFQSTAFTEFPVKRLTCVPWLSLYPKVSEILLFLLVSRLKTSFPGFRRKNSNKVFARQILIIILKFTN